MKFFNTYGRSRNFTVDGTEELLNSVNCDIHFKVSLFNSYSAAETIEAMKIFIKDYFEEVNDNGMNGIYISNLIQSLENEFDDIKYIKFISINGYNTFVQCVENSKVDIESLDKDERIAFIPEFLNIDIDKEGKDILIGFNPRFLIDALKVIDDETISIYLVNPKAPCFIRDDEENYTYLILPVNINQNQAR